MERYSCNNISVIVTNVIMLEFLSARFVHALLPYYLFFEHEFEHENVESY